MKEYEFTCPKHGKVRIEVEKPPLIMAYVRCPFCDRLARTKKVEMPVGKSKWVGNYT